MKKWLLNSLDLQKVRHFPLMAVSSLVSAGAISAIALAEFGEAPLWMWALFAAGHMGIPLFFANGLAFPLREQPRQYAVGTAVVTVLLVAFYLVVLQAETFGVVEWVRLGCLFLAAHLVVTVAPFWRRMDRERFWLFNVRMGLNFVIGGLFTGFLVGGLLLALGSVQWLFGVNVPEEAYSVLGLATPIVLNTFLFITRVQGDREQLALTSRPELPLPKVVSFFLRFILLPLLAIYTVILYLFISTSLLAGEIRSGWGAGLSAVYAVLMVAGSLLSYPAWRGGQGSPLQRFFGRWAYVVLLPPVGLMAVSTWQRIAQYGYTESRYFLVAMVLWLTAVVALFVVGRGQRLAFIPLSLLAAVVLTNVGPWSAYAVSKRSQVNRMEAQLASLGMATPQGALKVPAEATTEEDIDQVKDHLRWLASRQYWDRLHTLLPALPDSADSYGDVRSVLTDLGLDDFAGEKDYFYLSLRDIPELAVGDYRTMRAGDLYGEENIRQEGYFNRDTLFFDEGRLWVPLSALKPQDLVGTEAKRQALVRQVGGADGKEALLIITSLNGTYQAANPPGRQYTVSDLDYLLFLP